VSAEAVSASGQAPLRGSSMPAANMMTHNVKGKGFRTAAASKQLAKGAPGALSLRLLVNSA
jgi:hypothetical protein